MTHKESNFDRTLLNTQKQLLLDKIGILKYSQGIGVTNYRVTKSTILMTNYEKWTESVTKEPSGSNITFVTVGVQFNIPIFS